MTASQSIYEGADAIIENVSKLLKLVQRLGTAMSTNTSRQLREMSHVSSLPSSTVGVSARQPWIHATMVSIIDLSLAHGRYPKLQDLPQSLQRPQANLMFPLSEGIRSPRLMIEQRGSDQGVTQNCDQQQLEFMQTESGSIPSPMYSEPNTASDCVPIAQTYRLWDTQNALVHSLLDGLLQTYSEAVVDF
jgi:hypothetical protein